MTSEEIREAIERLGKLSHEAMVYTPTDVLNAITVVDWVGNLIDLLEQADPYTHMKLPVDADGEPWHVGDITESIFNEMLTVKSISPDSLVCTDRCGCSHTIAPPSAYRHPRKPTVSEILDELEGLRGTGDYEAVVTRAAELASQLREMMQDD